MVKTYCQKCGSQNTDDANFCYKCGNGLIKIEEVKEEKTIEEVKEEKTNVVQPPKKKVSNWQYLFIILAIIQFLSFLGNSSNGELKYSELGSGFLFLAIVFALRGSVRLFGVSFLSLILLVVFLVISGYDINTPSAIQPITNIQSTPITKSTPFKIETPTNLGSYESPASIGTTLSDYYAEFTVLEVNKNQQTAIEAESKYLPDIPSGYTLHLIKIQIKNIRDEELKILPTIQIKVFKDGQEVNLDTIMKMIPPKQFPEITRDGTIMPGATSSGWLVIYVPKDTDYLIQYKSGVWSKGVWVKIP